jgi:transcriptional regulator with XRE-family HTH domain
MIIGTTILDGVYRMAYYLSGRYSKMLFRDELIRLRNAAGLSQEKLAVSAGISVANIRNYEQNRRLPSFPVLVKMAAALGVSCEAFAQCEDVKGESEEKTAKKPTTRKGKK